MSRPSTDAATGLADMRQLVVDLALDALLGEYGGTGAAVFRPRADGRLTVTASRMPSGWTDFWFVATSVRELLQTTTIVEQTHNRGYWLVLQQMHDSTGPIAAAVILDRELPRARLSSVSRLIRSVLLCGDPAQAEAAPEGTVVVNVEHRDVEFVAEVRRAGYRNNEPVRARGETIAEAVATAATRLCDVSLTLRFAAKRTVMDHEGRARDVSVVVVEAHDGGPVFGFVVSPPGSVVGPAEAVMGAASFIEQDQLATV